MTNLIAIGLFALLLSGCQTTGSAPPTVEDTVLRVCPPVRAVLLVLENSPTVDPDLRLRLKEVDPVVALACSGEPPTTFDNLNELASQALPVLIEVVATAKLSDDQKSYALLSLAIAQAVIATVPK
jgi:hypothetical protein